RLVIGVVGAPERRELAVEVGTLVGEFGGAQPVDRFRSGLRPDLHQLVADLVDRLLPGEPGPLAVDQLHRVFQPAVAVHELAHRGALGAMRAAVDRRFPARLLADPYAVRHFGHHRAADRAVRADVLADGDLRAGRRRRTGLRLAHAAKRQCAERSDAAGDQAGAAQEGAAVEAAARLALQRARQRAAAGLTFGSFDQHGRPLTSADSG